MCCFGDKNSEKANLYWRHFRIIFSIAMRFAVSVWHIVMGSWLRKTYQNNLTQIPSPDDFATPRHDFSLETANVHWWLLCGWRAVTPVDTLRREKNLPKRELDETISTEDRSNPARTSPPASFFESRPHQQQMITYALEIVTPARTSNLFHIHDLQSQAARNKMQTASRSKCVRSTGYSH